MADSPQNVPPKVFISYAWKNQAVAKQLQRDLQRDGVEVFVDYEKISGGDSLPERISAALDWCNTLVLLWSADSAKSFYVRQEWTSAFHLQRRVIPCVLDPAQLPALLRGLRYLNFANYEKGYSQLCRTLKIEPPIIQVEKDGASKAHEKVIRILTSAFVKIWQTAKYDLIFLAAIGTIYFSQNLLKTSAAPEKQNHAVEKKTRDALANSVNTRKPSRIYLRHTPKDNLPIEEVKTMLVKHNFFAAKYDWNKDFSNPQGDGIANEFVLQHGDSVVFDKTTGLMWQRAGSENYRTYADAEKYVRDLRLAGYRDWRLPTLEEAMSLMERKEYDRLHIDPKFDKAQTWIWTADKNTDGVAWVVSFGFGSCNNHYLYDDIYGRAVR